MTALGEWLVQQGTAKEAGKEVLLGAVALLEPPRPPIPKGSSWFTDAVTLKPHVTNQPLCHTYVLKLY